jgi:hypothetical protein
VRERKRGEYRWIGRNKLSWISVMPAVSVFGFWFRMR